MRGSLVFVLVLVLVGIAAASDLGNQAPVKTPQSYPENVPDPARQGGDLIADAMVIPTIPYNDTGTTVGYTNDYDAVCPYDNSTAPDVVYRYVADSSIDVDIDLCGSGYDTKLYVYDAGMALIACNDDFYSSAPCGNYVSKVENVTFDAGGTYYIIIDGYGSASGDYVLEIIPSPGPCILECPNIGDPEGEPPLVDDYVDNWNGGCNTDPMSPPLQPIRAFGPPEATLCGVSGWYIYQGDNYRDTDWFLLDMGSTGTIEITADAEQPTNIFELGPWDCNTTDIVQSATAGPCAEVVLTISGYWPGDPVWFWVGPTVYAPPSGADSMYDYVVWFSGLESIIATESTAWGTVKALFE